MADTIVRRREDESELEVGVGGGIGGGRKKLYDAFLSRTVRNTASAAGAITLGYLAKRAMDIVPWMVMHGRERGMYLYEKFCEDGAVPGNYGIVANQHPFDLGILAYPLAAGLGVAAFFGINWLLRKASNGIGYLCGLKKRPLPDNQRILPGEIEENFGDGEKYAMFAPFIRRDENPVHPNEISSLLNQGYNEAETVALLRKKEKPPKH